MSEEKRIGIVDYGGGNIQSVRNALASLGTSYVEVSRPDLLEGVGALVFPGQGAFGDSMGALLTRELVKPLRDWIRADRPFFGICIGYQVLFEKSDENPGVEGLGVFKGRVARFKAAPGLKVPHMGWNTAQVTHPDSAAWEGLGPEPYFYFVHSYFPVPTDAGLTATWTEYGGQEFASSIQKGNLLATQFHPEKSQANGLRLLENFVRRHAAEQPAGK